MANRVLVVGSRERAQAIATNCLDELVHRRESDRAFTVFTGLFQGVPLSIINTGMGTPMVDFTLRETRAVVDGPMYMCRYGTSGIIAKDVPMPSILVSSKGAVFVRRNPDAFAEDAADQVPVPEPYTVSKVVLPSAKLSEAILREMKDAMAGIEDGNVVEALNVTADSFYSSQGRLDPKYDDRNQEIIDNVCKAHPDAASMEMESFHLFDLARCNEELNTAAAVIGIAHRHTGAFLESSRREVLEKKGGYAMLKALASMPVPNGMEGEECVWHEALQKYNASKKE